MTVEIRFGSMNAHPAAGSAVVTFHITSTGDAAPGQPHGGLVLTFEIPSPASLDEAVKKARQQLFEFAGALTQVGKDQIDQNARIL
jgi:hypothetical protein